MIVETSWGTGPRLHILVALLAGTLTPREEALVADEPLAISDIVLWELAKLVQRGRLRGNYSRSDFAAAGVISRPRASWST